MIDIGLASYALAAASYAILAALLARQWSSPIGPAAILTGLLTMLWAAIIAIGTLGVYPPILYIQSAELARDIAWLVLLLQLNGLQSGSGRWTYGGWHWRPAMLVLGIAAALLLWAKPLLKSVGISPPDVLHDVHLSLWLLISVGALLLIEQLYRNASPTGRWSSKFICLGIGGIFAYDFFMYAEALLFRQLDSELWWGRGIVMAVVVPWLAVGLARQQAAQIDLHVSRQVVFHSVTLMGAGLYLLCMSLIGYYIRFRGGDWGGVLQLGFSAGGLALLLSLMFSGRLRANLRVQLNKHFFSYRYDYREQWLKFTTALAGLGDNVGEGLIESLGALVGSPAGLLFAEQQGSFRCLAHWHTPAPESDEELGAIPDWIRESGWVMDLQEWRQQPAVYGNTPVPPWLAENPDFWLLVPLAFREHVIGIVVLKRAELKSELNWEDRDLLKTAGRQAATHLSQHLASEALLEARQFDAFNRLSAYVVHDLKNILAQQSLMIANADRHKHNPAFVDDMINTIANSVKRMQRLMDQMRSGIRDLPAKTVDVGALLNSAVGELSKSKPVPGVRALTGECYAHADPERLATVFTHLVQNAQEATEPSGSVDVALRCDERWISVEIQDTGHGMTDEFIRERLFRPFDSTKGLTGMGIGAFESREYVRQLGGDIRAISSTGSGSTFTVTLPRADTATSEEPGVGVPEQAAHATAGDSSGSMTGSAVSEDSGQ